jgi:predicted transcriptional regulator YheO
MVFHLAKDPVYEPSGIGNFHRAPREAGVRIKSSTTQIVQAGSDRNTGLFCIVADGARHGLQVKFSVPHLVETAEDAAHGESALIHCKN